MYVTMINDNVSVSFSARRSKIERKSAMKTWDKLKATYLIALLHISNEKTAYLFEICRYIKYFQTRTKHLLCLYVALTVVCLISYSSQTRSGTPPPPLPLFLRLLDSLMIDNVLTKFEKNLSSGFFSGE